MATRIGINGFGRIGRFALRAGWARAGLEFVHINEPKGGVECAAHLLEFDTVHGRWDRQVDAVDGAISIDDKKIAFSEEAQPGDVSWAEAGVDIVLECSGKFRTIDTLSPYLENGVAKVIVAAPIQDERAFNIVMGVNDGLYEPDRHHIVTAASCTTNCLAPVVKVVHEALGIERGSITTIHDVTNTQVMVDAPHKDLRRARSGLNALIPTTTGSATAITLIYPELAGKLNGHAVRVPLLNASLTDCVFELSQKTDAETVNDLFREAAAGSLSGILGVEEKPLVSTDFVNDPRSGIVDALSTMVVDGTHLKVYAWYDNEWGYACRMIDLASKIAASLDA